MSGQPSRPHPDAPVGVAGAAPASDADVRRELERIVDPCSTVAGAPIGIVSMGLVRRLRVRPTPEGSNVEVHIGVTEPGCLMAAPFVCEARERLAALPGVRHARVRIDVEDDWSPEDMTPDARARLSRARHRRAAGTAPPPDRPSLPLVTPVRSRPR